MIMINSINKCVLFNGCKGLLANSVMHWYPFDKIDFYCVIVAKLVSLVNFFLKHSFIAVIFLTFSCMRTSGFSTELLFFFIDLFCIAAARNWWWWEIFAGDWTSIYNIIAALLILFIAVALTERGVLCNAQAWTFMMQKCWQGQTDTVGLVNLEDWCYFYCKICN